MQKDLEKVLKVKVNNIHNVIIVILVLAVLVSNFHFVAPFFGGSTPSASNQKQTDGLRQSLSDAENKNVAAENGNVAAEKKITALEFDRIRLQDSQNILLAIQDFYFQKNSLPNSLANLKGEGFLDQTTSFNDPETNQPYFYEKRTDDFVLCIKLSDMLKGMNTSSCPTSEGGVATPTNNPAENNKPLSELEIVGNAPSVNVRQEPNTNSPIIAKVKPSDTFEFSEIQDNWYKIVVQEGVEGWVSGNYIKVFSSQ